jgi:ribosomal protein L16/L10AE
LGFIKTKPNLNIGMRRKNIKHKKIKNKNKKINYKRKKQFHVKKIHFCFGDKGLFCINQTRIEKIYLKIIRKFIRKKFRKKRKKFKLYNKYWIRFSSNLILTKKSKNARMGSGKGKYLRSSFLLKKNKSFIEFKLYDYYYICALKIRIYQKLNINLKTLIFKSKLLFN